MNSFTCQTTTQPKKYRRLYKLLMRVLAKLKGLELTTHEYELFRMNQNENIQELFRIKGARAQLPKAWR